MTEATKQKLIRRSKNHLCRRSFFAIIHASWTENYSRTGKICFENASRFYDYDINLVPLCKLTTRKKFVHLVSRPRQFFFSTYQLHNLCHPRQFPDAFPYFYWVFTIIIGGRKSCVGGNAYTLRERRKTDFLLSQTTLSVGKQHVFWLHSAQVLITYDSSKFSGYIIQ